MSVLRVWGRKSVANVQKVLWVLHELNVPFELDEGGAQGSEPRDATYLRNKKAPTVPVIDDDGFVLWEGNSIARYLARKHGTGSLWPSDPRAAADAERWMDYQLSTARVHLHPLMRDDLSREESLRHQRGFARDMEALEATLQTRPYVTGDAFTVGDVPMAIVTFRWFVLDVERPKVPAIEAWFDRIKARPAFRKGVVVPDTPATPLRTDAAAV